MPRNSSSCSARHARFNAQQLGLQSTFWLNVKTCTFVVSHSGCAFTLHKHLMFVWSRELRLTLRKRKKRSTKWPQKPATWPHLKASIIPVASVHDLSRPAFPQVWLLTILQLSYHMKPHSVTTRKRELVPRLHRHKCDPTRQSNPENNHLSTNLTDDLEPSKRFPLYNLIQDDQI